MHLAYESRVGGGAYGDVWRATDNLGRTVAVKFFNDTPTQAEQNALNHAKALVRVESPAVVRVFALEPQPHPESGADCLAIIMEYVAGPSLSLQGAPLTVDHALAILRDLATAVEAIHSAGLVHGDLHAGNVLITRDGAKVADILYTRSLAEAGTRTAQRTRDDDRRNLAVLFREVVEKTNGDSKAIEECYYRALSASKTVAEMRDIFSTLLGAEPATTNPSRAERRSELPAPLTARPEEQVWLARVRAFVTGIRQEQQSKRLDIDDALERADHLQTKTGTNERAFDDEARELLVRAKEFYERFYGLDPDVYAVLARLIGLNMPALRSPVAGFEFSRALQTGKCNYYAFENAARVFRAVRAVCSARGQQFSDDLRPPERQSGIPSDARLLCVRASGSLILLEAASDAASGSQGVGPFRRLGTYAARAAPLCQPQLRAFEDGSVRMYARDSRTVYRWSADERRPEFECSVPSSDPKSEFGGLRIVRTGPIEFFVEVGAVVWAKAVGDDEIFPLAVSRSPYARILPNSHGVATRWVAFQWQRGLPAPDSLTREEADLANSRKPSKSVIAMGDAITGHEGLLSWQGKPLELAGAYGIYADRYQGYECALLVCALQPYCTGIFFVDLETGASLRTPLIAPCDVGGPTIVVSGSREYLVCRALARSRDSVIVFGVSDNTQITAPAPLLELGNGSARNLTELAPGRFFVSFEPLTSQGESSCGIIDFTDPNRRPHLVHGPVTDGAADDAILLGPHAR
jgi:tRNA A-37 threonylcarbamoyl transferase component Bud32